jgi:hypothetical protein
MNTNTNAANYMVQTVATVACDLMRNTGCTAEHATNTAYKWFMDRIIENRPDLALIVVKAMASRVIAEGTL